MRPKVGQNTLSASSVQKIQQQTNNTTVNQTAKQTVTMSGKLIVLITGGNTGLGLEAVKALCKTDTAYEIIIGCRSASKGESAIETVKKELPDTKSTLSFVEVDLASDVVIKKAFDEVSSKHGQLDILINNGGAGFDKEIQAGELSIREAWNKSWDTNVAGTQVMTSTFIPLLLKSSEPRLLFVTSGTSTLTETEIFDNPVLARINASPEAGWPKPKELNPISSYRSSKTGLNMAMREWHRILKNDGVKVCCISPGFLATGLAGIGTEQLKKVSVHALVRSNNSLTESIDGRKGSFRGWQFHQGRGSGQAGS